MMPRVLSCLRGARGSFSTASIHAKYILFSCIELNLGGNTNNGKVCHIKIEYYIISQTIGFVNRFCKTFLNFSKKFGECSYLHPPFSILTILNKWLIGLGRYRSVRASNFAEGTIIRPLVSLSNIIPLRFCSGIIECCQRSTITKSRPVYCFYANRNGDAFQSLVGKCRITYVRHL